MRPMLSALLAGLALAVGGCGKTEPTKSVQELNDMQNNAQKQVDDDEREFQKSAKKK